MLYSPIKGNLHPLEWAGPFPSLFWWKRKVTTASDLQLGNMEVIVHGGGAKYVAGPPSQPWTIASWILLHCYLGDYSHSRVYFVTGKVLRRWRKLEESYLGTKAIWLGRGSLTADKWHSVKETDVLFWGRCVSQSPGVVVLSK